MRAKTLPTPTAGPARGREIGALIGGSGGMAFVVINSAGLPPVVHVPLLVIGAAAFVLVIGLSQRSYRRFRASAAMAAPDESRSPFSRRYWVVVAIEAVALFAGVRVVAALGYPQLGVSWVSFVVGTHFFALGRIFGLARFHVLAVCITLLGLAGFGLAALGWSSAIAVVSGVAPGFILLAFALSAFMPLRIDPVSA